MLTKPRQAGDGAPGAAVKQKSGRAQPARDGSFVAWSRNKVRTFLLLHLVLPRGAQVLPNRVACCKSPSQPDMHTLFTMDGKNAD